jgi:hypothetical protein
VSTKFFIRRYIAATRFEISAPLWRMFDPSLAFMPRGAMNFSLTPPFAWD